MAKMMINLRSGVSMRDLQNGSILIYDATKNDFYTVTPEKFMEDYEIKFKKLSQNCNDRISKIENSYQEKNDELTKKQNDFISKIQATNEKLIQMVEAFIKGGK